MDVYPAEWRHGLGALGLASVLGIVGGVCLAQPLTGDQIADRHGHPLSRSPTDESCAPDVVTYVRRLSQAKPGTLLSTYIDGDLQVLAQKAVQSQVLALSRSVLPKDQTQEARPLREGEYRVGTVVQITKDKALLDLGVEGRPLWADLPLPRPPGCPGHPAPKVVPFSASLQVGERRKVRVMQVAPRSGLGQVELAPQAAILALRPKERDVVALSGGYFQRPGDFDRVTQGVRELGGTFHPFLYAAALASRRYGPHTSVDGSPLSATVPSPLPLRLALSQGSLGAAGRLVTALSPAPIVALATRFGFPDSQIPTDLGLLTRVRATPWQVAGAYAVFADTLSGRYQAPRLLAEDEPETGRKPGGDFPPALSYLMSRMLHGVVISGTATEAQVLRVAELCAKNGISASGQDSWFVGYHADLLAVAWVGYEGPPPKGEGLPGSEGAMKLFLEFMNDALVQAGRAPGALPRPEGLIDIELPEGTQDVDLLPKTEKPLGKPDKKPTPKAPR